MTLLLRYGLFAALIVSGLSSPAALHDLGQMQKVQL
jgi:hypothetical protein